MVSKANHRRLELLSKKLGAEGEAFTFVLLDDATPVLYRGESYTPAELCQAFPKTRFTFIQADMRTKIWEDEGKARRAKRKEELLQSGKK